jgi:hypothetical protein
MASTNMESAARILELLHEVGRSIRDRLRRWWLLRMQNPDMVLDPKGKWCPIYLARYLLPGPVFAREGHFRDAVRELSMQAEHEHWETLLGQLISLIDQVTNEELTQLVPHIFQREYLQRVRDAEDEPPVQLGPIRGNVELWSGERITFLPPPPPGHVLPQDLNPTRWSREQIVRWLGGLRPYDAVGPLQGAFAEAPGAPPPSSPASLPRTPAQSSGKAPAGAESSRSARDRPSPSSSRQRGDTAARGGKRPRPGGDNSSDSGVVAQRGSRRQIVDQPPEVDPRLTDWFRLLLMNRRWIQRLLRSVEMERPSGHPEYHWLADLGVIARLPRELYSARGYIQERLREVEAALENQISQLGPEFADRFWRTWDAARFMYGKHEATLRIPSAGEQCRYADPRTGLSLATLMQGVVFAPSGGCLPPGSPDDPSSIGATIRRAQADADRRNGNQTREEAGDDDDDEADDGDRAF